MWKILLIALAALFSQDPDQDWETWKSKYNKSYPNKTEDLIRRQIWEENLKMITLHNLEFSKGMHGYDLAMNDRGDLTPEERSGCEFRKRRSTFMGPSAAALPDSIEWRQQGYITDVKNQRPKAKVHRRRQKWTQITRLPHQKRHLGGQNLAAAQPNSSGKA